MSLLSPGRRRVVVVVAAAVVVTVVSSIVGRLGGAQAATPDPVSRADLFRRAAAEFGVPEEVLLALSYNESRWEHHHGPSVDGGYGLMNLVGATEATDGRGRENARPERRDADRIHTLDQASRLLGVPAAEIAADDRQNVRGGAAVLAAYARELNAGSEPATPTGWYDAVARYSGAASGTGAAARLLADAVFATIHDGASRVTQDRQRVTLAAQPQLILRGNLVGGPDPRAVAAGGTPRAECPAVLRCMVIPATRAQNDPDDPGNYGNYDLADRAATVDVRYIVIHDTEGSFASTVNEFQSPLSFVSAHYVIRSSDGAVAQMVPTRDIAWHAGNWWVNMHSIGIEHEGFAVAGATWYSEAMYRSSAVLVRYLAARYHIPLDRDHILGHDNVVGPTPEFVAGMHWDPGPYWDWNHYLDLVRGTPSTPGRPGPLVTITPRFQTNQPVVTDCGTGDCVVQPPQPTNFVYLRTAPDEGAPLLSDVVVHSDGAPGTAEDADWSDKVVSGQRFVEYARRGDWVGIWFGGRIGWLHDPAGARVVRAGCGWFVTPRRGLAQAPVYGRSYPEPTAYRSTGVTPLPVVELQYVIAAGQRYVTAGQVATDYYSAVTFAGPNTEVVGVDRYYQISFNHRQAFVRAADVALAHAC